MAHGRSCTTKKRFRDALEAKEALQRIKATSRRQVIPKRWYHCERCKGYHLTSRV